MRIGSIGCNFENKDISHVLFRSTMSLLDYDLILWDPSFLFDDYSADPRQSTYSGYKNLSNDESVRFDDELNRRKTEMIDLLENGRPIVIFVPTPTSIYHWCGHTEYSGSGRNQKSIHIVQKFELNDALPFSKIETIASEGDYIEFRGDPVFKIYWDRMKEYHYYSAYFKSNIGNPFLFIKGTEKPVGTYIKTKKSFILLLPSINPVRNTKKESREVSKKFLESLLDLIKNLQMELGDFSLPSWSDQYQLPEEKDQLNILSEKEGELKELIEVISKEKERLNRIKEYKLLFSGTGKSLELVVKRVFEEIGFTVKEGKVGRDDLILGYNGKVAVAEIKGLTKSASEKNAAQLEKWVMEYLTENSIHPKGFLIINPYNNLPLKDRDREDFPHQMLQFSEHREHCLITTIQLLGLFLKVKEEPDQRDNLVKELFSTVGKYPRFQDYKEFIRIDDQNGSHDIKEDKAI
jgi:hypothetical protein